MTQALLYPYQQSWVKDQSRFKIGMMSRQVGKTFTSTLECVLDCAEKEAAGSKARWVILSRGERQAKEAMLEGVHKHCQALQIAYQAHDIDWQGGLRALEVTLPGGSRITALPANPDTARGFSANVILDEFAFHQDSRAIWSALFPVISKAGLKLRVISTPNGKANKFYELMTQGQSETQWRDHGFARREPWSMHCVNIHRAVADGLDRNIDELRAGLQDEDAWQQEYLLNWMDSSQAWLPFELISTVENSDAGDAKLYAGGQCFIGVDIATRNDLFVIWVLERVGDVLWTREIVAERRLTFAAMDELLDDVMQRYNVLGGCIDQTGMGEKPVEDARRRYGNRMRGVIFTGSAKQHLATQGKQRFEDMRLRIPQSDAVRRDLHKLKKETSPTGAVRFIADSDSSGHADRAWALFLAIDAAATPTSAIAYTPIPTRRDEPLSLVGRVWSRFRGLK